MNKKAAFYKYAKLYSWLIKEAEKIRDYNYIPKNSVFSAKLAEDYWYMRNWIQNNPDFTPSTKAFLLTNLNKRTRSDINDAVARARYTTRATTFRQGLVGWEGENMTNNINKIKEGLGNTNPMQLQVLGGNLYFDNMRAGEELRRGIATSVNAENALGLVAKHIENPQVRKHIETVPVKVEGFTAPYGTVGDNAGAHYSGRKGEIVLGSGPGRFVDPHAPIHEGMHGVQYVSPNASNEAKAQWLNYTNDKNSINKPYSYVDANGATVTSPRANATYAVESGANQLANDYTRKATENLPRRMRNTIRKGMLVEGDRTNALYQRDLGINPNATIPQEVNPRKFSKAVNAAARMAGVNAKENLGMARARQAMGHRSFINDAIETLRSQGYEITPEMEANLREGYNDSRRTMHYVAKRDKRQAWLERVKKNPALLEKAKRLGRISRFVKIGHYKRMCKTFKRLLLQSV